MHKVSQYFAVGVAVILFAGACVLKTREATNKDVIKITAKKFEYLPPHVELRKGVPVTLELTSLDRIHGFNIPDLGLRADVIPGQTVRVELLPKIAGRYTFLCDIFCGTGHDEMSGVIVVTD